MISNRDPLWLRLCADLEQEDPLFVRSHISAEFLEATMEIPCENSFGYCAVCKRVDPFCPHQTEQFSRVTGATQSVTGMQPWGTPIASAEPCPHCGERPWWSYQDSCVSSQQDEDEILEEMYDWK